MRQLGFNTRRVEAGFYETAGRPRPFRVQALADAFAKSRSEDYFTNQKKMFRALGDYYPGQFRSALRCG